MIMKRDKSNPFFKREPPGMETSFVFETGEVFNMEPIKIESDAYIKTDIGGSAPTNCVLKFLKRIVRKYFLY